MTKIENCKDCKEQLQFNCSYFKYEPIPSGVYCCYDENMTLVNSRLKRWNESLMMIDRDKL